MKASPKRVQNYWKIRILDIFYFMKKYASVINVKAILQYVLKNRFLKMTYVFTQWDLM